MILNTLNFKLLSDTNYNVYYYSTQNNNNDNDNILLNSDNNSLDQNDPKILSNESIQDLIDPNIFNVEKIDRGLSNSSDIANINDFLRKYSPGLNNNQNNFVLNEGFKVVDNVNNPSNLSLDVNVQSNALTVFGEGLKTLGTVLETYSPAIGVTAVGAGTAYVLNTLPPAERAGAILTTGVLMGGTFIFLQSIKTIFSNSSNRESNLRLSNEVNNLNESNYNNDNNNPLLDNPLEINRELTKSPDIDFNSFANSPLEELSNLNQLITGLMIVDLGIFLGILLILFNLIIKFFKLEEKEFVKSRPYLHKWVSLSLKGREYTTLILTVLVLFGSCSMFYGLTYLLYFLNNL